MMQATIKAEGKTLSDLEDAIKEALRRIEQGNVSGYDGNTDGHFFFEVKKPWEPKE